MNPNPIFRKLARALAVPLLIGVALAPAPSAHAASFTVDSTTDAVDANPGDGICATAAGECTLRAAVQETNALAGADSIALPSGTYVLTIGGANEDAGARGDLDIRDDLTLTGAGAPLTEIRGLGGGLNTDRVLEVCCGAAVTLSGVTIRKGVVMDDQGGGVLNRGATLILIESAIVDNLQEGDIEGFGGGIYNNNSGVLTIHRSLIARNTNSVGDGIAEGGGIYNAGLLFLNNSTLSGNLADSILFNGDGGGIYNTGTLTLRSSTIAANKAEGGSGGGLYVRSGDVHLANTLLAGNQASNGPDCQGDVFSSGYNLVGSNADCAFFATTGDLVGTPDDPIDPLLGPLQDNGGPTFTQALLAGSLAIDAGDPTGCADDQGNLLPTDQRLYTRPVDGNGDGDAVCDIGAYEFDSVPEDFTLAASPATQQICAPADAVYDVNAISYNGYSDPVALSASGHPPGTTAVFVPNPVTPPGNSVLTIGNTGGAGAGEYLISIVGVGSASMYTTTVELELSTLAPGPVSLISPEDGAADLLWTPEFVWSAAAQGVSYSLEIATDVDFTDLVYTASVEATSHTVESNLAPDTLHYWRVRAENGCGPGEYSPTFTFTTRPIPRLLQVNSTADAVDERPGDADCATSAGECTLRAGIQEANALPGGQTIRLPAGTYTLTLPGTAEDAAARGDLDVAGNLTLKGAGAAVAIIDGNGDVTGDRVFDILGPVVATFSNVTVTGGTLAGIQNAGQLTLIRSTASGNSGDAGGGVANSGTLTLRLSVVSGNSSSGGGAGVYNTGTLTVADSLLTGNRTDGVGGGIYNLFETVTITGSTLSGNESGPMQGGGGIENNGTLVVLKSKIIGNTAGSGGGIHSSQGSITLQNSTVSGNHAIWTWGGGLSDSHPFDGLTSTISGSTISGNTAATNGGGIIGVDNGGLVISNSTISGNMASGNGGGIFNWINYRLQVDSSTITGNSARAGGGIYQQSGQVTLRNTILAANLASFDGPDCRHIVDSAGYNLVGSDGGCIFNETTGDLVGTPQAPIDPLLGPLQDNGGPTFTHALLEGSPAIDAGTPDDCPPTDQRKFPRPVDGDGNGSAVCDIGSFEYGSAPP